MGDASRPLRRGVDPLLEEELPGLGLWAVDDSIAALELELAYEPKLATDEPAARRSLRAQFARLERDLAACLVSA